MTPRNRARVLSSKNNRLSVPLSYVASEEEAVTIRRGGVERGAPTGIKISALTCGCHVDGGLQIALPLPPLVALCGSGKSGAQVGLTWPILYLLPGPACPFGPPAREAQIVN